MALRKVKSAMEHVLDKNLQDLVRGIRNHKDSEGKYISECVEEIKVELKQDTIIVKANAITKLIYLQMLGYDISWAGFNIVEVMSSPKFTYKRIGYLAASQSFHDGTDVIMLTTNLVRKDLNSTNTYDAGVALSSLSCFMTGDLAHDLANDIMVLMASTKPYLRKKAVLLMYKVFLRFPDSLKPAFGRLKEKLEDPDPGVQSAAVNVICELARKNPQNYLNLAPLFFKLMTTSTNNWVLIKIIKLFGALIPLEPRLGKKLIEPLTNLIHSTSAMSLLYECINTVIAVLISISSGLQNHATSVQLCVQKLQILIEDSDQNLKYLGLLAMSKILQTHPKSVQAHKELIMQCLDDKDESIRLRALSLLYGMVSKKNLMEIVKKLILHMEKAEGAHYRDELLGKIIGICSQNDYRFITNFEWYVSVLVELAANKGMKPAQGRAIANQLLDVAIRVKQVRRFAARQMSLLLRNHSQIVLAGGGGSGGGGAGGTGAPGSSGGRQAGLVEVLYAAAWICGEFADCLIDESTGEDLRRQTLDAMSLPYVSQLPGEVQAVFVHNQLKLYASLLVNSGEVEDDGEEADGGQALTAELLVKLEQFVHSDDLEVQERAVSAHQLLKCAAKALESAAEEAAASAIAADISALFAGELNPVAPKAQRKVPLPEGLDLDAWINEPPRASAAPPSLAKGLAGFDDSGDEEAAPASGSGKKASGKKKAAAAAGRGQGGGLAGAAASPQHGAGFSSYSSSDPPPVWGAGGGGGFEDSSPVYQQPSAAELSEMRENRLREQASNPHYLKPGGGGGSSRSRADYEAPGEGDAGQLPSVGQLDDPGVPTLRLEAPMSSDYFLKRHRETLKAQKAQKAAARAAKAEEEAADEGNGDGRRKRRKKKSKAKARTEASAKVDDDDDDDDDDIPVAHAVSTAFDMPEGAAPDSDAEGERAKGKGRLALDDPHRLLSDIKLDDLMVQRIPTTVAAAKPAETSATTTKKKKVKKAAAGEAEDAAEGEAKPRRKKSSRKTADAAEAPAAAPGKKKKAKKLTAASSANNAGGGEDLLMLVDDDEVAAPLASSPTLWLPVGESLTARVDVAWRPSSDAADAVNLAFRIVQLTASALVESATLEIEGRRPSSVAFEVSPGESPTATARGVSGDALSRTEGKLRASVAIRWAAASSEAEVLRVRVPRLCRLVPAAIDAGRMQSALASAGQQAQVASARIQGIGLEDCLARLRSFAAPVLVDEGAGATLHSRALGLSGPAASLYLLLKRLPGDGAACGLEAKSIDPELASESVAEIKKLLGKGFCA